MSILENIARKAGAPIEVIKRAFEDKARDERGEGTFGGLATDEDMVGSPTTPRVAAAQQWANIPEGGEIPASPIGPTTLTKEEPPEEQGALAKFGDFAKSTAGKVWGQVRPRFDAGYVTGDRPMTAWDFATDVLSAAGPTLVGKEGIDIHKRNIELREQRRKEEESVTTKKTAEANAAYKAMQGQKIKGELHDKFAEGLGNVMMNADSDLWDEGIRNLTKSLGVEMDSSQQKMVKRALESIGGLTNPLTDSPVTNPREVLEAPPGTFPNEVVARLRHANKLIEMAVEKNVGTKLDTETKRQALGINEEQERRAEAAEGRVGSKEAARKRAADLIAGGAAIYSPEVQAELTRAGVKPSAGMGGLFGSLPKTPQQAGMMESLLEFQNKHSGRDPNKEEMPGVVQRGAEIARGYEAQKGAAVQTQKDIQKAITSAETTKVRMSNLANQIAELGIGKEGWKGKLKTAAKDLEWKWFEGTDPIGSISGHFQSMARDILNEVGPLTEQERAAANRTISLSKFSTEKGFALQYNILLGLTQDLIEARTKYLKTGEYPPIKSYEEIKAEQERSKRDRKIDELEARVRSIKDPEAQRRELEKGMAEIRGSK